MNKTNVIELMGQADEEFTIISLYTGQKPDGKPFYAYVAVPPSKYEAFKKAAAKGCKLTDFGDVLAYGYGKTPRPEIQKKMKEQYGFDPEFESRVVKIVKDVMDSANGSAGSA